MRERPILFSRPMVRAILDGRKTTTRRVVKFKKDFKALSLNRFLPDYLGNPTWVFGGHHQACPAENWLECTYGRPGDKLWVRETWGIGSRPHPYEGWIEGMEYKADLAYLDEHDDLPLYTDIEVPEGKYLDDFNKGKWQPSIHMYRWMSRITLEITGVRVERLQEITAADCIAEGIIVSGNMDPCDIASAAKDAFRDLWDSINGKTYPWSSNPWAWCISFRRIN